MADTGAPWNLPYPLPTDLVRDGAQDIQDLAEATADGLSAAGGLVAVKHVLKTDTFVSGSVAAGANVAVPDLEITHEVADENNRLIITVSLGVTSTNVSATAIGVHDGTNLIAIGDAEGSRTRTTAGGGANAPQVATFVHTPGSGSKTYTVRLFNIAIAADATLFVNRTAGDSNDPFGVRTVSSLVIQEVKV